MPVVGDKLDLAWGGDGGIKGIKDKEREGKLNGGNFVLKETLDPLFILISCLNPKIRSNQDKVRH